MNIYMLDTCEFNRVLKHGIQVDKLRGLRVLATHVQWDELNATADSTQAGALRSVFEQIGPEMKVTSSAFYGVSRWDECSWAADDGIIERMLERLRELDAKRGKKYRDSSNPVRDVLIADTAIKNGAILVSEDCNLRQIVSEFGGRAIPKLAV